MSIGYNVLFAVACCLFGYLVGSIPNGILIGHIFFHDDPRKYGSHNSGGTNTGRVFGKKIGIITIVMDALKTTLVYWVIWAILSFSQIRETITLWDDGIFYNYLALFFAALGHCFSPWLKFQGGKAVACFAGAAYGTSWLSSIFGILTFFPLFKKTKIMSISTLTLSAATALFEWLMYGITIWSQNKLTYFMWNFGAGPLPYGGNFFGWEQASVLSAICVLVWIRHASNIDRIKHGQEKKVDWK
ncbi:MAG: glycerol-3-phosphate 1-O-acyltransferase PlsY [Erysipelotrichaceae bacterium]|nr:glycerol-3-phosphate 1-O-acyltransferase PlsY [Erysipelotrichaceae bacterium]